MLDVDPAHLLTARGLLTALTKTTSKLAVASLKTGTWSVYLRILLLFLLYSFTAARTYQMTPSLSLPVACRPPKLSCQDT